MAQSGDQVFCRETGKMKNCAEGTYADYEEGHTGGAALCNGGVYDRDSYDACPSRPECMRATEVKEASRRSLPIYMGNSRLGATQIVGQTPAATPSAVPINPTSPNQGYRPGGAYPTSMAARTTPAGQQQQQIQQHQAQPGMMGFPHTPYPVYVPQPVQPPNNFPMVMQTPFAAPVPFHAGGISPTFLPDDDEPILLRLLKNMTQGAVASSGWHMFDLARSTDWFGRRRR